MSKLKEKFIGEGMDFDSEDRVRLLGIIDQLRELGLSQYLSLPQIVVVGDQSSGKSSVLEGLTGLGFPIVSELCTRFVTHIVLRRTTLAESSVRVSILPGPSASDDEERKEHLRLFGRSIEGASITEQEFAVVLDEAAMHMGLPSVGETDLDELPKRFSDDILKIELCGPNHPHLSVVDVPGLFYNLTKY